MEFKSNIEAVIKRFQSLANNSQAIDFSGALSTGVNAAMGQMKFRVFNTGKDAKGVSFGKYVGKKSGATNRRYRVKKLGTEELNKERKALRKGIRKNTDAKEAYTEYEKERLARGRQVGFKDLELTGGLRRGIIMVAVSTTKVVVYIPNKKLGLIAQGQEKQISKIVGTPVNIWGMSDEERELMKTNINEALKQLYARVFNS